MRYLKTFVVGAVGIVASAGACSSSSSNGSGGGGASGTYCADLQSYATACGGETACDKAIIAECTSYASNFSDAYLNAITSCFSPPYTCSDGGEDTGVACEEQKLATITPTAAQAKVKADFCAVCPDGASSFVPTSCSSFFSTDSDSGLAGVGTTVLFVNDTFAAQIDSSCVKATPQDAGGGLANDCAVAFDECEATIEIGLEPAACLSDAGGGSSSGSSLQRGRLRAR